MKYTILGYSGSGKSTFASKLEEYTNIKSYHLDRLFFNPNWVVVDDDIFENRVQELLTNNEWIIDGNYSRFGSSRFIDSDLIFIFNFNRFKSLWNLIKRRIKYNGQVRDSSAEGCYEKLDLKFIKFVLFDCRTKARRNFYKELLLKYPSKVIFFKSHRQVNKYLDNFNKNGL